MIDAPSVPPALVIKRLMDCEPGARAALVDGIERIFVETTTQDFSDAAECQAFRDLWLGQYLERDREHVFLALDRGGSVAGYLVGCWDHLILSGRFAALGYVAAFAGVADRYPAHLHVNVTASARSQGVGAQLVEAFCARTAAAGLTGVHVVTRSDARNVRFYHRLGFLERGRTMWNGNAVVFLGRDLVA